MDMMQGLVEGKIIRLDFVKYEESSYYTRKNAEDNEAREKSNGFVHVQKLKTRDLQLA